MNTIAIQDIHDERLDVYARLTEVELRSKLEPQKGVFIAESFKVIERALEAGYTPLSFVATPRWVDTLRGVLHRYGIDDTPVYVADIDVLKDITGFKLTRGVLACIPRPVLPTVEEITSSARRIAVLDNIVDHTNVGAIFRSAAALSVDAVLVTPTCCDPLYRRSVRVSMGTIFQVPWTRIGSSAREWPGEGIQQLHDLGFTVAALALQEQSISLGDPSLHDYSKLALVFGTEGDGLSQEAIEGSDIVVRIPMANNVDSLNVAAASSVVFWELCDKYDD